MGRRNNSYFLPLMTCVDIDDNVGTLGRFFADTSGNQRSNNTFSSVYERKGGTFANIYKSYKSVLKYRNTHKNSLVKKIIWTSNSMEKNYNIVDFERRESTKSAEALKITTRDLTITIYWR